LNVPVSSQKGNDWVYTFETEDFNGYPRFTLKDEDELDYEAELKNDDCNLLIKS